MYYAAYSQIDLDLGLVPQNIDSLHYLYGLVGTLPLHKQTNTIVSPLYLKLNESLDNSIEILYEESLSTLQAIPEYIVEDSPQYSRYLQLNFSQNLPNTITSITYDSIELEYEYLTSYGNVAEVMLLADIPGNDVTKIRVEGLEPSSFIRVISVGSDTSLLGTWQPLVGTSGPMLSTQANAVINQGKLSSVGPFITIT
jgi:hypothetical protein